VQTGPTLNKIGVGCHALCAYYATHEIVGNCLLNSSFHLLIHH
jgi:hypothetical protein